VAVARTGSGKTLAYALPLVQRLRAIEANEGPVATPARPRGVVLTSTRELVNQTCKAVKILTHSARLRVRALSGGETLRDTRETLGQTADVLVANPPRLARLVAEGQVSLADVRIVVVDEADTLLAPGQRPPVEAVLTGAPSATIWWASATLPEPIRQWLLARKDQPVLLWSKDAHSAPESVSVRNLPIQAADRADAASNILISLGKSARGIVFANRRETAALAGEALRERGHDVVVVHGGQLPRERERELRRFVAGEGRVLVTTELAGRGLDVQGLAFVLNWELPERASDYVHRIGRVGRMGKEGRVFNLVTDRDRHLLGEVERIAAGGKLDTGEPLRSARTRKTTAEGVRAAGRRKHAAEKGVVKRFEK
jgi:ATP-dependent RNA helicase RhlE